MQYHWRSPFGVRTAMIAICAIALTSLARAQSAESSPQLHNNLDRAMAIAKETGQPLMIILRCPP